MVHCREGLATIVSETVIGDNEYFVVVADKGDRENIYVLKARTENIIRPVMTKEEAQSVIAYMRTVEAGFISNTKQRRDLYKNPETFIYCDNFADGNLYQCIYEQGGHDINSVMRVMYNGLPKLFD